MVFVFSTVLLMGDFYGVDAAALSADLAWLEDQVIKDGNYRDMAVIDRLTSVSERAQTIARARESGRYDTWEGLRVSSRSLANVLEVYRDKHPRDAAFPFVKEKADFGHFARDAIKTLADPQD